MRTWFDLPITTILRTAGWFIQNRMQVSLDGITSLLTGYKKHSNESPFAYQNSGIAVLAPLVSSLTQSTVKLSRAPGTTMVDITDGDVPSLENWNTHESQLQRRHWRNLHWEISSPEFDNCCLRIIYIPKGVSKTEFLYVVKECKVFSWSMRPSRGSWLGSAVKLTFTTHKAAFAFNKQAESAGISSGKQGGWNRLIKPRQERSQTWNQNSTGHRSSYSFPRK
jgi:hypothetical protein